MSIRKKGLERNGTHTEVLPSVWLRTFTPSSKWPDKDEFLDVVYWLKQIVGLLLGLAWGLVPLKGVLGIAIYFVINAVLAYLYSAVFQGVDMDDFGGIWDLIKEGLMTALAGFLVSSPSLLLCLCSCVPL
ncbi:C20orf24 [Cordylochernes scorpioides]|uniref:C20orf24 n=1 Tax=Cordylochernes scorpioides TaxID=51811 RepID=A0ABY6K1M8_9ARAC|nr:C20orf24 [Cordylochernes scorpioides]